MNAPKVDVELIGRPGHRRRKVRCLVCGWTCTEDRERLHDLVIDHLSWHRDQLQLPGFEADAAS